MSRARIINRPWPTRWLPQTGDRVYLPQRSPFGNVSDGRIRTVNPPFVVVVYKVGSYCIHAWQRPRAKAAKLYLKDIRPYEKWHGQDWIPMGAYATTNTPVNIGVLMDTRPWQQISDAGEWPEPQLALRRKYQSKATA